MKRAPESRMARRLLASLPATLAALRPDKDVRVSATEVQAGSLSVNRQRFLAYDFKAALGFRDPVAFVAHALDIDRDAAKEWIRAFVAGDPPRDLPPKMDDRKARIAEDAAFLLDHCEPIRKGSGAARYFEGRGIALDSLGGAVQAVHGTGIDDPDIIVAAITTPDGAAIGCQSLAVSCTGHPQKLPSGRKAKISRMLLGHRATDGAVRINAGGDGSLLVVEGVEDAAGAVTAGWRGGVVASLSLSTLGGAVSGAPEAVICADAGTLPTQVESAAVRLLAGGADVVRAIVCPDDREDAAAWAQSDPETFLAALADAPVVVLPPAAQIKTSVDRIVRACAEDPLLEDHATALEMDRLKKAGVAVGKVALRRAVKAALPQQVEDTEPEHDPEDPGEELLEDFGIPSCEPARNPPPLCETLDAAVDLIEHALSDVRASRTELGV